VIVKPWCEWLEQVTAVALIVHVTLMTPPPHVLPLLSATGFVPTKESWLSRASDGCPTEERNTKPGSPMPLAFGGGTGLAPQSSCAGDVPGGWIATPHVTFPPSAVHRRAPDVEAHAAAGTSAPSAPSAQTKSEGRRRSTCRSLHSRGTAEPIAQPPPARTGHGESGRRMPSRLRGRHHAA